MGERRDRLLHGRAGGDVVMGRRRLDGQRVAGSLDADQILDLAEIDHVGRRSQPLLHDREQGVAAGEIFGLRALGEQRRGFVDAGGAMIGGLVHGRAPPAYLRLLAVNGVPDPVGRRRHFQLVVADRVGDGVDHGGGRADRAGLAAALDAERIARAQRRGVVQLERRQVVGARHGVVHERRGHELAVAVVDRAFEQRLADALREAAMDLALDDHRVDQPAEIVGRDEVDEARSCRCRDRPRARRYRRPPGR